ncbi:hypothetical protein BT69DRAFT_1346661 [Atractiella rhizophila]|nr:hypothetical protein BT69DRAFT_1346661 [Atractiella rhizophila]
MPPKSSQAAPNNASANQSRRQKQRNKAADKEKQDQNVAQQLKVVVRKLPQELPENVFWKTVEKWIGEEKEKTSWTWWSQGKIRKMKNKHDINSRAYITFKNYDDLLAFHQGFDGWLFRDKQGTVYQAVVDFAPFQKTPVPTRKTDPRQGTIDEDEEYKSFLDRLANPPTEEPEAPPAPVEVSKTTPLLQHIRAQREAEKEAKEAKAAAASRKSMEVKNILTAPSSATSKGGERGRAGSVSASNVASATGKEEGARRKRGGKGQAKKVAAAAPAGGTGTPAKSSSSPPATPTVARRPHTSAPPTRQLASPTAPIAAAPANQKVSNDEKPPSRARPAARPGDLAGQRRALGAALSAIAGGGRPRRAQSGAGGEKSERIHGAKDG